MTFSSFYHTLLIREQTKTNAEVRIAHQENRVVTDLADGISQVVGVARA